MNNLDSYFEKIKTESDYWTLRRLGFLFEFYPMAPQSWEEHIIMRAQREAEKID